MEEVKLVKELAFGDDARGQILAGVNKLTNAVSSTLGASGKCVILENHVGQPMVTKDGVTVANSIILKKPIENIGATLVKQAAQRTVQDAGDGTTTATVLAHAILDEYQKHSELDDLRSIKNGINTAVDNVVKYLQKKRKKVSGKKIDQVAAISANNDKDLGKLIGEAFRLVDETGIVMMETNEQPITEVELVEGVQYEQGLKNNHFINNKEKGTAELENPLVLIVESKIHNIRRIQGVLEHVIKTNKSLLIIADVESQVTIALAMNKVKGNIKVNIIDLPGFGPTKKDATEDLAILTGATVLNEELGDDLDLMKPEHLGEAEFAVTDERHTVLTLEGMTEGIENRIDELHKHLAEEQNGFIKKKLEDRLAMLSGSVGIIRVGANSKVELKEKKDRVEDAIYATKAALQEGIVPGGGVALLNASQKISTSDAGKVLLNALSAPYETIMDNAGLMMNPSNLKEGYGCNVINGTFPNMIREGIIDPVLVTKSALKNAVSVALTIMSADCVISNVRIPNASS